MAELCPQSSGHCDSPLGRLGTLLCSLRGTERAHGWWQDRAGRQAPCALPPGTLCSPGQLSAGSRSSGFPVCSVPFGTFRGRPSGPCRRSVGDSELLANPPPGCIRKPNITTPSCLGTTGPPGAGAEGSCGRVSTHVRLQCQAPSSLEVNIGSVIEIHLLGQQSSPFILTRTDLGVRSEPVLAPRLSSGSWGDGDGGGRSEGNDSRPSPWKESSQPRSSAGAQCPLVPLRDGLSLAPW